MICREIAYQSCEKTLIDNFVDNSKNKHLSEFKFSEEIICLIFIHRKYEWIMTFKNNKQIIKIPENSKINKMQQNMVVMYQFGERLLVYNVNVCILQMINECICKIFKIHVMRFIGAMI